MKFAGIAGLLAVVTAVTGAAIPKVNDLENATEADIAKLEKDLAVIKNKLHQGEKRQVGDLLSGVTAPVQEVTGGLLGRRQVGDLLSGVTAPVQEVTGGLLGRRQVEGLVEPVVNSAGQLVNSLTGELLKREGVDTLVNDVTAPVQSITGGLLGRRQVGDLLSGVTAPVQEVTGGLLGRDELAGDLLNTVEEPVKGLNAPVVTPLLDTVDKTVGSLTSAIPVKREDPISQLAGGLLPQLTKSGVLPENFSLSQLTSLLNVLNAKGLIGNLEQVLGGLLNGGLLKTVTGLIPVKRDDAISQLAGGILPEVEGILPQEFGVQQLTGLLQTLQLNGLLTNLQSVLGGLL